MYDNKDIYLTLLEYRNAPISKSLPSPAQLLYGRRLKGQVPMKEKLLEPKVINTRTVRAQLKNNQVTQKQYYDRKSRNLEGLEPGDKVVMQNFHNKTWEPGYVVSKDHRPSAYRVKKLSTNRVYVRNRRFLKKIAENNFGLIDNDDNCSLASDEYSDTEGNYELNPRQAPDAENNRVSAIAGPSRGLRGDRIRKMPDKFNDYVVYK